jgi:hypothetical protein
VSVANHVSESHGRKRTAQASVTTDKAEQVQCNPLVSLVPRLRAPIRPAVAPAHRDVSADQHFANVGAADADVSRRAAEAVFAVALDL